MKLPRLISPPRLAAEPPSDFVSEGGGGGGGGRRTVWKVLGVGCLAVVLLGAVLMSVGAFKVASCCGDAKRLTEGGQRMGAAARSFGAAVQEGDYASAHTFVDPQASGLADEAALRALFKPHEPLMREAVLLLDEVRPLPPEGTPQGSLPDLSKVNQFKVFGRFYPLEGDAALRLTMTFSLLGEAPAEADGEQRAVRMIALKVEPGQVDLAQEAPARAVRELHGMLQGGDRASAYLAMAQPFREASHQESFEAFIDEQGDLFTQSVLKLQDVRYDAASQGMLARVTGTLRSQSERVALVNYEVMRSESNLWHVSSIAPMIQAQVDASADLGDGAVDASPDMFEAEERAPADDAPTR